MRFQQLTAPVTAKGVEDTAFYNYNRLVALNEVGGDPGTFGESIDEFHGQPATNQKLWPTQCWLRRRTTPNAREDVRIRIGLLSEMPDRWAATAVRWQKMNAEKRRHDWPDRNTEYLIYQTLVGAWPIDRERLGRVRGEGRPRSQASDVVDRCHGTYETPRDSVHTANRAIAASSPTGAASSSEITPAWHATSLAQTLMKLTAPGVPDIYQGTELWDLSLVDPDNRRPVDWELRRSLLERSAALGARAVMAEADSGMPKIWLIQRALVLRAQQPELHGPKADIHPDSRQRPCRGPWRGVRSRRGSRDRRLAIQPEVGQSRMGRHQPSSSRAGPGTTSSPTQPAEGGACEGRRPTVATSRWRCWSRATVSEDGLRVWAPDAATVAAVLGDGRRCPCRADDRPGWWKTGAGFPPERTTGSASTAATHGPIRARAWQPEGVNGPAGHVDPAAFRWTDEGWQPPDLADWLVYEMHMGTFSNDGTFEGRSNISTTC